MYQTLKSRKQIWKLPFWMQKQCGRIYKIRESPELQQVLQKSEPSLSLPAAKKKTIVEIKRFANPCYRILRKKERTYTRRRFFFLNLVAFFIYYCLPSIVFFFNNDDQQFLIYAENMVQTSVTSPNNSAHDYYSTAMQLWFRLLQTIVHMMIVY